MRIEKVMRCKQPKARQFKLKTYLANLKACNQKLIFKIPNCQAKDLICLRNFKQQIYQFNKALQKTKQVGLKDL